MANTNSISDEEELKGERCTSCKPHTSSNSLAMEENLNWGGT